MIRYTARRLRQSFPREQLQEFLGPDVGLVPTPGSSLHRPNSLWVPRVICDALVSEGLGRVVLPYLRRDTAVPKSAFCAQGERPSCERHYETISVHGRSVAAPAQLCIVDDVVTRGATLLACASRLADAFPGSEVRGFALCQTYPFREEHTRFDRPGTGAIALRKKGWIARDVDWWAWPIEPEE